MSTLVAAAKFGLVGLLNTGLSLGIIYLLAYAFGVPYVLANAIGYTIAFLQSFLLNRAWTFGAKGRERIVQHFAGFVLVFAVSYVCQLGALLLIHRLFSISEGIAQLPAMVVYTGVNFLGNRFFVFNKVADADRPIAEKLTGEPVS